LGELSVDTRLLNDRFPRSNKYHPAWVIAGCSGGANPLWLTEWLTRNLELRPGMRVLDLGCGRALSSIFLRLEFEVDVWAVDLWFSASENLKRIRDAGVENHVYPMHAEARALPFADDFFDAMIAIDSFPYFGTDDHYLNYLARLVKPGGAIGIAGAGLIQEIESPIPDALAAWWEPSMYCLHSHSWWQSHWKKTGIVDVELADSMPDGWQVWLEWQAVVAPKNLVEIRAIESDAGKHVGYVRVVSRRRQDASVDGIIDSVPTNYVPQPLLRSTHTGASEITKNSVVNSDPDRIDN
jgi:SAM-dependent methyltransferase